MPVISLRRLPLALSCSRHTVYVLWWKPYPNHHAPVPVRQFAPSWAVCKNSPFSPTAAPYPVTVHLSPTRKSTLKRHWQQPLVEGVQEITDAEFLKLKPYYG